MALKLLKSFSCLNVEEVNRYSCLTKGKCFFKQRMAGACVLISQKSQS